MAVNDYTERSLTCLFEFYQRRQIIRQTNANVRPTNGPADGLTDKLSYRDARTHLSFLTHTFIFRFNRIGDGGAAVIAEFLKRTTTLRELNLMGNDIGGDGGE